MPTLAAGSIEPSAFARPPRQRGFTLVELLVALVILGVLATSVTLALPDAGLERQREVVRRLADQLAWANLQAEAHGQSLVWQLHGQTSRLSLTENMSSNPADEPPPVAAGTAALAGGPVTLPDGLGLSRLEYEGQLLAPAARLNLTYPPAIFVLTLGGTGRRWRVSGDASGHVGIEEEG